MCIIEKIEKAIETNNKELLKELLKRWDNGED